MASTARLELRLDPATKEVWRQAAAHHRLSLSGFVHKACQSVVRDRPCLGPEEIDAIDGVREQLRRAGVNLNELLKLMHFYDLEMRPNRPGEPHWYEVRRDLAEALARVHDLLETTRA